MGSIRKAPRTGRWEARYRDPFGAQRTSTFDRKGDAQAFLASMETDKHRGAWMDPSLGRLRFADFVEQSFLPTRTGLELTSQARDLSYLRTHILPVFGARPIASIDYTDCQAWVNELATRRAPATVVKAAQIMGRVLKMAVRARVIAFNPMTEVERPTVQESEDVYLTAGQVAVLADAMDQVAPRYRALVWVGCYAGPRIGELAALRWSDIDLDARTLTISRKVVEVTGHGMVEGNTKTKAGRRTITLPRNVVDELERHKTRFPSDPLVFTGSDGGQIRANNLRGREWAKAVRLWGLDPAPTFHDMATLPCPCGWPAVVPTRRSPRTPVTARRPSPRTATPPVQGGRRQTRRPLGRPHRVGQGGLRSGGAQVKMELIRPAPPVT